MADDTNTNTEPAPSTDVGTGTGGEVTLNDDIARAFEEVETRDAPPAAEPVAQPSRTTIQDAPAPALGERARGADGRFLPGGAEPTAKPLAKPAAAPAPAPAAPAPAAAAPKPAEPAAAPALRAPVSWKPAAREHWAKLPVEVQQEVARRESEVARTVHESAKARDALTHVQSVIGPYAQNINASGVDAITMMGNLFRADNTLRHGSIIEKASVAADIIKSYGIDLHTLDSLLAGQQPSNDPTTMMADRLRQEMRQQLQPVMSFVQQMRGRRESALAEISSNASTEVTDFGADKEFFNDVRADMADIIDMYTQRGASISLQEAYDKAIKINPHVSEIIAKRAESERAQAAAQAAQRARRTAVSLSSAPAPAGAAPGPAGEDRRAAIEAAWDAGSSNS